MSQKAVSDIVDELESQVIYDVTANNDGVTFGSLSALLSDENLSTLIPPTVRCGGMSIRFIQGSVQNSDNKYVKYFLTKDEWSISEGDWQQLNLEEEVNDLNEKVNGVQAGKETVEATFTDGIYMKELSDNSISVVSDINNSLVTLDNVIPGSTYEIKLHISIDLGGDNLRSNYFVFAKTDSLASIASVDIPNYVTEIDATNHIYRVVIPSETTKFHTAVLKNSKKNFYAKRIIEATTGLVGRVDDLENTVSGITEGENTITGKQINGSPIDINTEDVTPIYTDGTYHREEANNSISTYSQSVVSLITIDNVSAGEVYDLKLDQLISLTDTLQYSYFIFAQTDILASIPRANITDYVTLKDAENYVYRLVVPLGTTKIFSACNKNNKEQIWVKKVTTSKVLSWLKVEGSNLSPTLYENILSVVNDAIVAKFNQKEEESKVYHLWDSIKKPIDFSGKTLVAFGDSITKGVSSPGLVTITDCYIKLFCDYAGSTLNNQAVSGSCLADAEGINNSIYDKVTGFTGKADIIWIAGGTNDWNTGKTVGTFGDTDPTTTYGALKGICDYIQTNYPNAVVIFVTPIPYTKPASSYPNHITDLNYYRTAIYDVATYYGYNVINGLDLGMPRERGGWNNTMCDDSDGCHPSDRGHILYARSLCGKLL